MVHLLQVPSLTTQRGAYPLVRSAAQKFSEKIVLEVGLNPTGEIEARLPLELINLLTTAMRWEGDEEAEDEEGEHASVCTHATESITHSKTIFRLGSELC